MATETVAGQVRQDNCPTPQSSGGSESQQQVRQFRVGTRAEGVPLSQRARTDHGDCQPFRRRPNGQ